MSKQKAFPPKRFELKGNGFQNKMKRNLKKLKNTWNKFLKAALFIAGP